MGTYHDFIIVGGGPAGCATAVGLAKSAQRPSVLLLEAGGPNDDQRLRVDGQRWLNFKHEEANWNYQTTPQEHCNNRVIDYSRGKGLGGSSAINFGVFSVGPKDDYDEWARITKDDAYGWQAMQARFKRLESFHGNPPTGIDPKYVSHKAENHGTSGPLHVGYAAEWERDLTPLLDVFEDAGYPLNTDHNSGNPLGASVVINSSHAGRRTIAHDMLTPSLENLDVLTGRPVQRLILDGTKAIGVEANGIKYFATREVILCAGAMDSPKILMHSGLGPRQQLQSFEIPVVADVPALGQNLRDHMFCPLAFSRVEGDTDRGSFYGDQTAMDEATKQWEESGTGGWSKFACELGIGWFKSQGLVQSKEFDALPAHEKAYLNKATIPHFEIISHFPIHWFIPDFSTDRLNYSNFLVFHQNALSKGEVTLQSADPSVPLRLDPRYLESPFDHRVAIEALRETLRLCKHEGYARNTTGIIAGPSGDSDEELLEYWKAAGSTCWHMTGTAKMGAPEDSGAVVDHDFRFVGIQNLRVADMSVVPILPNCHTQVVAYLTGATCADKLIDEYNLS
ncbi:Versicolorin B synthase like protein [Verticillium longisporum]|uniref:Versicolorin B synthase like protein n=1 Tax=Verticillium longisporum TaxID=100787 RepID=A0A8I3AXM5_VERLO|nr:Versicolorin B synthase like protein [Verticillium longisporum]